MEGTERTETQGWRIRGFEGVCMYVCISSKIHPQSGFSGFASIQGIGLIKRRVKQTRAKRDKR